MGFRVTNKGRCFMGILRGRKVPHSLPIPHGLYIEFSLDPKDSQFLDPITYVYIRDISFSNLIMIRPPDFKSAP